MIVQKGYTSPSPFELGGEVLDTQLLGQIIFVVRYRCVLQDIYEKRDTNISNGDSTKFITRVDNLFAF